MGSQNTEFAKYIVNLFNDVPGCIYETLIVVFCVGLTVLLITKGIKKGGRYFAMLLLAEYIFLLYCTTVAFRLRQPYRVYKLQLFYSYSHDSAKHLLLIDNVMNIIVFIPVGVLMSLCWKRFQWWKILIIGCSLSLSIESLQYILIRGNANVDDIIHNTLGCMLGYGLYKAGIILCKR